jgi:hypothetical protein
MALPSPLCHCIDLFSYRILPNLHFRSWTSRGLSSCNLVGIVSCCFKAKLAKRRVATYLDIIMVRVFFIVRSLSVLSVLSRVFGFSDFSLLGTLSVLDGSSCHALCIARLHCVLSNLNTALATTTACATSRVNVAVVLLTALVALRCGLRGPTDIVHVDVVVVIVVDTLPAAVSRCFAPDLERLRVAAVSAMVGIEVRGTADTKDSATAGYTAKN